MRKQLEDLSTRVDWIDTDNLYQAVSDLKKTVQAIIELLDVALPKEVDPD